MKKKKQIAALEANLNKVLDIIVGALKQIEALEARIAQLEALPYPYPYTWPEQPSPWGPITYDPDSTGGAIPYKSPNYVC